MELDQECSTPGDGYRIRFPSTWYAPTTANGPRCRFFNPEPFSLPAASEATGVAITVQLVSLPLVELDPGQRESPAFDVVMRRESRVSDRRAVRVETVATGGALLPRGARAVTWYVDFPSGSLVASTNDQARDGSLAANARVLDAMVASAQPVAGPTCSASGMPSTAPRQELPAPVAAARSRITELATRCDYDGLARFAQEGQPFTYSFGDSGRASEYWREAEQAGRPVLRQLVTLLGLPFGTRDVEASVHYLWPAAFAYDSWDAAPARDRDALRALYGEDRLRDFAAFGSYAGYRVGITAAGDWLFFVAGD